MAALAALAVAIVVLGAAPTLAHGDRDWLGDHGWPRWNGEPLILLNLGAASILYIYGLFNLWGKAGIGRGLSVWQAVAFGTGMASLLVALLSRLDALSGELLSAHMIQHMVLMNVAAPLLVLGSPALIWFRALPRRWQGALVSRRGRHGYRGCSSWHPWLIWTLYAAALWVWHLPLLYQVALRNPLVHDLQHISLFVAACLFWGVVLDPDRRWRLSRGIGVLYLFTTSLHATLLGVFMALAPRVWYEDEVLRAAQWNLTALEDQQLAGLIMWMPGCMVYAIVAAVIFFVWLQEPHELGER